MAAQRRTEIKRFMRAQPRPERRLKLLLHDVEDPVNVGSAFRIADALHAEQVLLSGITPQPPHKLITKVGRAKDRRVDWRSVDDLEAEFSALDETGWVTTAVEIASDAEPYHLASYGPKVCLVVGHEDHGLPAKVLSRCTRRVFIPMYGKGASLNVHVALAVTAFHVLHAPRAPDLPAV